MTTYPFPWKFDPARYSDFYLLSRLPEAVVQAQILEGLHKLGIMACAVDVGAKNVRGRAFGALKRAGVKDASQVLRSKHPGKSDGVKGFPDLNGVIPPSRLAVDSPFGVPLYLEVKAPRWIAPSKAKVGRWVIDEHEGEPTEAQLRFLLEAHHAGAAVGVVWSLADALAIVHPLLRVAQ